MNLTHDGIAVSAATGGVQVDDDRPRLVLVHGAGMDRTVWQMHTRYLAHHGVAPIAIDLPGHGATPGPARESIGDYADWLARVIAENDLAPCAMAGHSMGALIALELAARAGDNIAQLILFGVGAAMPVHPTLIDAAADGDRLAGQLISGWGLGPDARTGGHPSPGQWMVGATQALLECSAPGVLASDLLACNAYKGAPDAAARITCPVTVVVGTQSKMTPPRATAPLIDALSSPTVHELPTAGHTMMIESPAAVRQILADAMAANA